MGINIQMVRNDMAVLGGAKITARVIIISYGHYVFWVFFLMEIFSPSHGFIINLLFFFEENA